MPTINDLTTLSVPSVAADDYLPIYDTSAATDKKTPLYVTGTWTPSLRFGTGTTGMTYASRTAYFSRVGNLCYFVADIRLSAKGSSTGNADIAGLPYTSSTNPNGPILFRWVTMTSSLVTCVGIIADASAAIAIYGATAATATLAALTDAAFSNSSILQLSGVYMVALT